MKLSPKKNGKGFMSSYSINIGSLEAQSVGFLDENNQPLEIEKIIDPENKQIIIKLKDSPE